MLRRNLKLALAGLLCLLLGGLGLGLAWRAAQNSQTVLLAAADIRAGQVLRAADFAPAQLVLGPGMTALPADFPVDGQVALADIPRGAVLVAGAVGPFPAGGGGLVRLAVVVEIGRAPVAALNAGSSVSLLGPGGQAIAGVLASPPRLLPDTARHHFDVWVPLAEAARLAQWVAAGELLVATP